jgi:uncharacterized delta-60 repeat protein
MAIQDHAVNRQGRTLAGAAAAVALIAGLSLPTIARAATTGKSMAIDSAGRILVAGTTNNTFALARYQPDGALDSDFGTGGTVTTSFGRGCVADGSGVAIDSSDRIVVAGSAACSGGKPEFALARYTPDGRLDPTFGAGGLVMTNFAARRGGAATALAIDSAGRIVVAGATAGSFALVRYSSDGTLDPSFGSGGRAIGAVGGTPDGIAFDMAGNVLLAGINTVCVHAFGCYTDAVLARFTGDGALDPSFGSSGTVRTMDTTFDGFNGLAVDGAGDIVTVGGLDGGFYLARYGPSGTTDASFGSNGVVTTDVGPGANSANAVLIDPSGRIVAGGFTYECGAFSCSHDFALARYEHDGTLDTSFGSGGTVTSDVGSGAIDLISSVALDAGGSVVAAGTSGEAFAVARYTPDGTLDPTFGTGGSTKTSFPPDTWISNAYIDARKGLASFYFDAGGPTAGFQCALRSKRQRVPQFAQCTRRRPTTYRHLTPGTYTFEVRGVFPSGPDPTPAKWPFRIR